MALPVVTVVSGGLPVTEAANGLPITEAANGRGMAVTVVLSGGTPVKFVTDPIVEEE